MDEQTPFVDAASSPAWGAQIDLATLEITTVTTLPPAPAITSTVNGRPLVGVSSSDFATSTFFLTAPGEAQATVTIPEAPRSQRGNLWHRVAERRWRIAKAAIDHSLRLENSQGGFPVAR